MLKDYFVCVLFQIKNCRTVADTELVIPGDQLDLTWTQQMVRNILVDRLTKPKSNHLTSELLMLLEHSNIAKLFRVEGIFVDEI